MRAAARGEARPPRRLRALAALVTITAAACGGDDGAQLLPPVGSGRDTELPVVVTSDLRAGLEPPRVPTENPYASDEHALAAGRELYARMNCAGCHGPSGGGGIGPPFADADWIYGGEPENIVQAILEGRPNGMPAFGGKLPASEAWKIAAYVKQLSAHAGQSSGGGSPTIGSGKGTSTAGRGQ